MFILLFYILFAMFCSILQKLLISQLLIISLIIQTACIFFASLSSFSKECDKSKILVSVSSMTSENLSTPAQYILRSYNDLSCTYATSCRPSYIQDLPLIFIISYTIKLTFILNHLVRRVCSVNYLFLATDRLNSARPFHTQYGILYRKIFQFPSTLGTICSLSILLPLWGN